LAECARTNVLSYYAKLVHQNLLLPAKAPAAQGSQLCACLHDFWGDFELQPTLWPPFGKSLPISNVADLSPAHDNSLATL